MKKLTAALLSTVVLATASAASAESIVVGAFGGGFSDNIRLCHIEPFEKATGATVAIKTGLSGQFGASLRAAPGNPDMDLVYINDSTAAALGNEGLVESIDKTKLTNAADIPEAMFGKDGHYVAFMAGATAIVYDPTKVSPAPTSWMDLYDPKYAGQMALPDYQGLFGMHLLLALNKIKGGDFDNIDPGIKAVQELVPNSLTFYTAADQLLALFERGEIVIAPWTPDRAGIAIDKGLSLAVAYPKEGAVGILPTVILPKGSSKTELATKYLDIVLSPEAQSCFAEHQFAGPVNQKVELSEKTKKILPSAEVLSNMMMLDPDVVASHTAAWGGRWAREIAR